jgi:hypothetical protein
MKKLAIIAITALCASAVNAGELSYVSAGTIKSSDMAVPAAVLRTETPKCGHVSGEITKLHLLAQANQSRLFSYAENETQFGEFKALWRPILEKFGMKVTSAEFDKKYGVINYESPDGRVVREFMGDKLQYNALDAADIKKVQHEMLEPLERAGMTPIASFDINTDFMRPTFNIYYLARPEENSARELQLRQMRNGDDIDFDLIKDSVNIVKKDAAFSLVYIGRELGSKTKLAMDEAGINAKLTDYRKFLAENNMDFIASRTFKLDNPIEFSGGKLNYAVNIYFFR